MKTLRHLLEEHAKVNYPNCEHDEDFLEECLREGFDVVWEGDEDHHRWRIEYDCVCEIDDNGKSRYFKYSSCKGTQELDWEGAGYDFEGIDNVYEVYPKVIQTVEYTTEKP